MSVVEEHADILQNIEMALVGVYRQRPQLGDFQVDTAMEALERTYQREKTGGEPVLPKNELAVEAYQAMKGICDWRLGKIQQVDEEGTPMSVEPVSIDVIQSCLRRLRRSLEKWNKRGGSQGYLNYISQFIR